MAVFVLPSIVTARIVQLGAPLLRKFVSLTSMMAAVAAALVVAADLLLW